MAAAQFVGVPGYAALLLRRSFPDLMQPDALIPRSKAWWMGKATWHAQERRWQFPSGATIGFGYLERDDDVYQYQGAAYQFIGIDELTQHTEFRYRYLFSRLRRTAGVDVPLRMRAGSNPGGAGHMWVKGRFLEERHPDRVFVPALLDDNPSLDRTEYVKSMAHLDPFTRKQLLEGEWVNPEGSIFRRHWFAIEDAAPAKMSLVRAWDLAATEQKDNNDPDWTAGVLMGRDDGGTFHVLDVRHLRGTPRQVEELIKNTARQDGVSVPVVMEQEPGASGVALIDYYTRHVLQGYNFRPDRPTGDKVTRAQPLSAQAEAGNVKLVRAPWNKDFLDEIETFPLGAHDDQCDAASLALARLAIHVPPRLNAW